MWNDNTTESIELNWATAHIVDEVVALLDPKTGREFRSKKAKRRAVAEIVGRHVSEAIRAVGEGRDNRMNRFLRPSPN